MNCRTHVTHTLILTSSTPQSVEFSKISMSPITNSQQEKHKYITNFDSPGD